MPGGFVPYAPSALGPREQLRRATRHRLAGARESVPATGGPSGRGGWRQAGITNGGARMAPGPVLHRPSSRRLRGWRSRFRRGEDPHPV